MLSQLLYLVRSLFMGPAVTSISISIIAQPHRLKGVRIAGVISVVAAAAASPPLRRLVLLLMVIARTLRRLSLARLLKCGGLRGADLPVRPPLLLSLLLHLEGEKTQPLICGPKRMTRNQPLQDVFTLSFPTVTPTRRVCTTTSTTTEWRAHTEGDWAGWGRRRASLCL